MGNKRITYIDIGTNQGTYLEFLSKFLKFKSVDCFEPLEDLCKMVKLNNSNLNIKTHNIALSNKNQIKNFIIIELRRNLVFINKIILLNL